MPRRAVASFAAALTITALIVSPTAAEVQTNAHEAAETPAVQLRALAQTRAADAQTDEVAAGQSDAIELRLLLSDALVHHAVAAQLNPSGIRREHAELFLTREQDQWTSTRLSTPSGGLRQRLAVPRLDASGLNWRDGQLSGEIYADIGRSNPERDFAEGENMHSMLKAQRKAVIDWSIGGRRRITPSEHRIAIDARILPNTFALSLRLDDFAGDPRAQRAPEADDEQRLSQREGSALLESTRQPLLIDLTAQDTSWLESEGRTPTWNRAIHLIDARRLVFDGARVHGELAVTLLPDPWVPPGDSAAGRVRHITCNIEATVDPTGQVHGTYTAKGSQGPQAGRVDGLVQRVLGGRYELDGIDGSTTGDVRGWTAYHPENAADQTVARSQVDPLPSAGDGAEQVDQSPDASARQDALVDLAADYTRIHRVLLQDRAPPAYRARLSRASAAPRPVIDPTVDSAHMDVAARPFASDLLRYARAAENAPPPTMGPHHPEDADFGPHFDVAMLETDQLPATTGQPGAQQWRMPKQWRTLGPIEQQGTSIWSPRQLPAVTTTPGVAYQTHRPHLDDTLTLTRRWRSTTAQPAGLVPHETPWRQTWTRMQEYGAYGQYPANELFYAKQNSRRSYAWYAAATLDSPREQMLWLAVRAMDYGRLWVNGRLVWDSGPHGQADALTVLQVPVHEGANEFLIESGKRQINYFPPPPWNRSRIALWVCTQGQPRDAKTLAEADRLQQQVDDDEATGATGFFASRGRSHVDAQPPLDWDYKADRNITWRSSLAAAGSPLVVKDGRLFTMIEPGILLCLDAETGREQWRKTIGADATGSRASDASQPQGRRASAAPVARNGQVWVSHGSGIVICLRAQDGQELWRRQTDAPWAGGFDASPLLCGDMLIVPGSTALADSRRLRQPVLTALNADTGDRIWQCDVPAPDVSEPQGVTGVRLVRGDASAWALATPHGAVIDSRDGRVLHDNLFTLDGPTVPIASQSTVTFVAMRHGQAAYRLWLEPDGRIGCRRLWEIRRAGTSSPQITAHGLVDDQWLILPRSSDENGGHHPVSWDQLDVYSHIDGQHLARPNPVIINAASPLPVVRAGDFWIVSDAGTRGWGKPPEPSIAYLLRGERPTLVQRIPLDGAELIAPPTVSRGRMYLRLDSEIICVGQGGDAQSRDNLAVIARSIIAQIGSEPRGTIPTISPPADLTPPSQTPVSELTPNVPPSAWLVAGPLPPIASDAPVGVEAPATFTPAPGDEIRTPDGQARFALAGEPALVLRGMTMVYRSDGTFYTPTRAIDVAASVDEKPHRSAYFFTMLRVDQSITARYTARGARTWISGVPVDDEQVVMIEKGLHPMLVRIDAGALPPVGRVLVTPRFRPMLSLAEARADWLAMIEGHRGILEAAVREQVDRGVSLRAGRLLQALDESLAARP